MIKIIMNKPSVCYYFYYIICSRSAMRGKTANATVLPGSFNIEHCGCSNVEAAAVIWLPCLLKPYRGGLVASFLLTSPHSTVASCRNINSILFSKICMFNLFLLTNLLQIIKFMGNVNFE